MYSHAGFDRVRNTSARTCRLSSMPRAWMTCIRDACFVVAVGGGAGDTPDAASLLCSSGMPEQVRVPPRTCEGKCRELFAATAHDLVVGQLGLTSFASQGHRDPNGRDRIEREYRQLLGEFTLRTSLKRGAWVILEYIEELGGGEHRAEGSSNTVSMCLWYSTSATSGRTRRKRPTRRARIERSQLIRVRRAFRNRSGRFASLRYSLRRLGPR